MAHPHWPGFVVCVPAGSVQRRPVLPWAKFPGTTRRTRTRCRRCSTCIHTHAEGNAWQTAGFRDEAIEGWLDKLLAKITTAAEIPPLKLPVRLSDVSAPNGPALGRPCAIRRSRSANTSRCSFLRNSILWADGNAKVRTPRIA